MFRFFFLQNSVQTKYLNIFLHTNDKRSYGFGIQILLFKNEFLHNKFCFWSLV